MYKQYKHTYISKRRKKEREKESQRGREGKGGEAKGRKE